MINLNGENFKEKEYATIFNGGKAGKVNNVTIAVTKKTAADADNLPDYKLVVTDENGGEVNDGFYYAEETKQQLSINRVLHIARAVLGADYEFPEYADYKAVIDGLFKLINKNADEKKFNIYVTYGNVGYPSKYLRVRYFDFLEAADTDEAVSRLFKKKNDLLERITEDAPSLPVGEEGTTSTTDSDDDWL